MAAVSDATPSSVPTPIAISINAIATPANTGARASRRHAFVPSLDHAALADRKLERLAAIDR